MEDREISILSVRNGYIVRLMNRGAMYSDGITASLDDTFVFETKDSMIKELPKILQRITPCETHMDLRTGKPVVASGTASA